MSNIVNPNIVKDFRKYGSGNWDSCFHCGNCTAVCSLTEKGVLFPRKEIRTMQLGLKRTLATNAEPWLCYYCGDCSESCPRDANPAELMMVLRRYLTALYDWTGLSALFYKSFIAIIVGLILIAVGIIGFGIWKNFNTAEYMEFGHSFEQITMAVVFGLILIPNIIRMIWFTTIRRRIRAPISIYMKGAREIIVHMFTQKNSLKCDDQKTRWLKHLLVVSGYILLLVLTVFFNWLTTQNLFIIWLGYLVGAMVFIFTFDFMIIRFRKKLEITKFSHPSDWMFIIWLFLMALSAFTVRVFVDLNLISDNTWLYIVHLIIMAQWAIIMVPFGKWMHFLYRSFAMYFANLKISEYQQYELNVKPLSS